jgi:hypothetical protein
VVIARHADLRDHELVREYLANANCCESRKERLVIHLLRFYGFNGVQFEPPRYRRVQKPPFIPESDIDQLIAGMDFERATVDIVPEKDSNPRLLKVSHKLLRMLNTLPKQYEYLPKFKDWSVKEYEQVPIQLLPPQNKISRKARSSSGKKTKSDFHKPK